MITAIICAAGKGERAGFNRNKVLEELNGLSVLSYSLSAFSPLADEMIVVCRKEDKVEIQKLLSPYPNAKTVTGGATRTESVYNGLKEAKGEIVLVHDAARPFVTEKIINDCIESVKKYGSGVCALPATDTTVLAENGKITSVPARKSVYTVQTPQGFLTKKLLAAYEQAFIDGNEFTDDSGIYAHYIENPYLFTGERTNKKLTYPEDFVPAERVGFGVDTHAFYGEGEGRPFINFITLGGVKIPSDKILKAHSDGDVLVHALMDALLSAAGLRDIGYYFPDTDPKYKGAFSMDMLEEVMRLVRAEGLAPKNVSIAILAETPRLSPHIERIKQSLSEALNLPENAIGVAAGTNERLGYVGEKKGITVYATALLQKI
ncbi:MAG: 2-C-methyl-D-erythritol 4-phosphate cytidylyltransferase [Clostridia bacterium]|nr:2-C-methyl-D-erythritol 4-phosphate cytidylyltransferase [Clostridia bacterium]